MLLDGETRDSETKVYVKQLIVDDIPNLMHQPYLPVYGAQVEDLTDPFLWGEDRKFLIRRVRMEGFEVCMAN